MTWTRRLTLPWLTVLAACSLGPTGSPLTSAPATDLFKEGRVEIVTQAGTTVALKVEVADSAEARAAGLMHRETLAPDAGMLLLHPESVDMALWMENTSIPLTAVGFDATGRIVWIEDLDPCDADSCLRYGSPLPVMGVLEVNRGALDSWGVALGDSVQLQDP